MSNSNTVQRTIPQMTIDIFCGIHLTPWINDLQRGYEKATRSEDGTTHIEHLSPLAWIKHETYKQAASVIFTLTAVNHNPDFIGVIGIRQIRIDTIEVSAQTMPWCAEWWFDSFVAWLDDLVQENELTDVEKTELRIVRGWPVKKQQKMVQSDYCAHVGISERNLRRWEAKYREKGFNTGWNN